MAATSTFVIADNSSLTLHKHLTGTDVPSAFASSNYGARIYLAEDSPLSGRLDDGWTTGKYLGYSNGRKGRVYQFSYVTGGVTYTLQLTLDDIKALENINVSEQ